MAIIICRKIYFLQDKYTINTWYENGDWFYVQAAAYKIYQKVALKFYFLYIVPNLFFKCVYYVRYGKK